MAHYTSPNLLPIPGKSHSPLNRVVIDLISSLREGVMVVMVTHVRAYSERNQVWLPQFHTFRFYLFIHSLIPTYPFQSHRELGLTQHTLSNRLGAPRTCWQSITGLTHCNNTVYTWHEHACVGIRSWIERSMKSVLVPETHWCIEIWSCAPSGSKSVTEGNL